MLDLDPLIARKKQLHFSDDSASPSRVQRDMTVESALEGARIVKTSEPAPPKAEKPQQTQPSKEVELNDNF